MIAEREDSAVQQDLLRIRWTVRRAGICVHAFRLYNDGFACPFLVLLLLSFENVRASSGHPKQCVLRVAQACTM